MSANNSLGGRTHHFAFDIHDQVKIIEIDRPARVVGLLVNQEGQCEYRVVYWLDGKRETEWVFAEEILLKPKTHQTTTPPQ